MTRIAVTASSLLLALPPGWCRVTARHEPAEPPPVQAACCPHCCPQSAPEESSDSKPAPALPVVQCCCQWDATPPEKSAQPTETSSLALPVVMDTPIRFSGRAHGDSLGGPLASGPPLHILQCVWLC